MDYLLKFPTKESAIQLGLALGVTRPEPIPTTEPVLDEEGNPLPIQEPEPSYNTIPYIPGVALEVIGYWSPDENTEPSWWVLVRANIDLPVEVIESEYVVWTSEGEVERDSSMPDRRFA